MTTVFGMKHPAVESTVLVADRQTTSLDQQTGIPNGKFLKRKLWVDQKGDYCFGHAGKMDQETYDFVQAFVSGKFDVEKILEKGNFSELRSMNLRRMGRKLPNLQELSGIVLATRLNGAPSLHTCFPLGAVEERIWTTAGSGDQRVIEYESTPNSS